MAYLHKKLASGRWHEFTLIEQMANIGAEISRAISWKVKGDTLRSLCAMERGLELFDLTIADKRWKRRLKEITRTREVVCDYFYGDNIFESTQESIDKYFLHFALAARNKK